MPVKQVGRRRAVSTLGLIVAALGALLAGPAAARAAGSIGASTLSWNPLWGPNPNAPAELIGVAVQNRSTGKLVPGLSFTLESTALRYKTSADGYQPTDFLNTDDGTGYPAHFTVHLVDLPPDLLPWDNPEQTIWLDNVNGNGKAILVTFNVFERSKAATFSSQDCQFGFVTALYEDVLGRWLDSDAQSAWPTRISSGISRAQVIDGILQSNEAQFEAITSFLPVSGDFRRDIDGDVKKTWLRQLAAGQPVDFIAADYANRISFGGPAGASGDGDPRHTVASFYRVLLGRDPTSAELATWAAYLGNGGRVYTLLRALDTSDEFYGRRIEAASQMLLHRPPTADERASLLRAVQGAKDWSSLWSTIAQSPAYYPACPSPS